MEKNLEKSRKEDEADDESSPEARDQKEKEAADSVTTVLGEMSLSGSKKDGEQDKDVIPSQDYNPPSDESHSLNESSCDCGREGKTVSILPSYYSPHSNLISSRTVTDSSSQNKKDPSEWDKKDQKSSFQSGALPVMDQQDSSDRLFEDKAKKIERKVDLDLDSQSCDTVDHSSDTNLNEPELEVNPKEIVSTKHAHGI